MKSFEEIKADLLTAPKKWLITGAAGFIGSNLCETLLELNQKVVGLDNFITGSRQNIDDVLKTLTPQQLKNFQFYEGDICESDTCKKAVNQIDYVLHQAALGSVPRSIDNPEATNRTNVDGFLQMLIAAKDAKVKRFIYASSSSVYGDSPILPKQENHIGNPLSPYAVSKYVNELYAKAFMTCYGIETIGLRYFNVFGPRQDPYGPYAAVIPLWIISLLKEQAIYINGDGETTRDFCFVENAVQANIMAAVTEQKDALNRVYNVTVGEQTTLNKLFNMIATRLKSKQKPIYRDFRNGDIRHSLADISQTQQWLGYKPTLNLVNGLEQTIDWFYTNQNRS